MTSGRPGAAEYVADLTVAPIPEDLPGGRAAEPRHDPDVRFTFANERTLLAWARTSLAVIAAGLFFAKVLAVPDAWLTACLLLTLVGTAIGVGAFRSY